ncbi:MAG: 1,4-alpha-glucan branching enzyme GlgB [Betaproteobacteria bacterium]|nr:1,4-alpha-glucan branching enzyme GlgB [Betaproteobacteria bacterium]
MTPAPKKDPALQALLEARMHDPFQVLGLHPVPGGPKGASEALLRVFQPHAREVAVRQGDSYLPLKRTHPAGVFELRLPAQKTADDIPYTLRVDGVNRHDPYAFAPVPPADDLYLFNEGRHLQAYRLLGANAQARRGVAGVCFRVWAPNAARVSVIGDFNQWDGRVHPMASLGASGVWELFIPDLPPGTLYKYELRQRETGAILRKTDPYGREFEFRPATAARVNACAHVWNDAAWMQKRATWDWLHAPLSIYEVHAGSWMRHPGGAFYNYRDMAARLLSYVLEQGYTHIEFMPLMEHPLDESWGYQCTGFFAPSSRFGTPADLRFLIDACHAAGIGVILDWVPGHFPADDFALAHFDGTTLYEHADPRMRMHPDWGTHVFNFGRKEVQSFLLSSAHYWLAEFHVDGLRVDAVASMLYLDYSRKAGEWLPNKFGGRENLEAMEFLRELNMMVHRDFPGALTIAEESTSWPMVSRPVYLGGLGFSMKWNMGWMNDSLSYMEQDPVHRRYHHQKLTFGQIYAYSENFVLPLSHDEVVHGKRSLLMKMPGDPWQRFANLRLLLAYQALMPGKKLGFMGDEIGSPHEWRSQEELPWALSNEAPHAGLQRLSRDLNRMVRDLAPLHQLDFEPGGFEWIDCNDAEQSLISFLRIAQDGSVLIAVLNFTPVPRPGYRLGVPRSGTYEVLLNSDSGIYGGSGVPAGEHLRATKRAWMGRPASLTLTLPPLAAVLLKPL